MNKGNKPNRLLWILGGIAVAAFIFVLERYINNFKTFPIANDSATWGTFGDYLGGTLNPIISFLALIGLLYTIHQQAQEMQATREELEQAAEQQRRQSEIFNLQQFESTFFSLLEQHNKAVEKIEAESIFKKLHDIYNKKIDQITTRKPSEELSNSHAIKSINQHYELKSYFNLLFQILKFISISLSKNSKSNNSEDSKITIKDFASDNKISKKKLSQEYITPQERMYSDILRSFIPNHILKLLALNCLTIDKFSQYDELKTLYNFQGLLNRYALLEQLQLVFTDINKIDHSHLSNGDDAIHFLILTSHADIAPAFGNNKIFDKFQYKFDKKLEKNTESLHKEQRKLEDTKRNIIKIRTMSREEYQKEDFSLDKEKYLEKLENEQRDYEEKIKKINAELKRIENNKKAWLEFLQIEDN